MWGSSKSSIASISIEISSQYANNFNEVNFDKLIVAKSSCIILPEHTNDNLEVPGILVRKLLEEGDYEKFTITLIL